MFSSTQAQSAAVLKKSDGAAKVGTASGQTVETELGNRANKINAGNEITAGSASNLLIRAQGAGDAARVHIEPNGRPNGTCSKLDLMLDPYEFDPVNYRIGAIYTKTGNGNGLNGENGAVVLNCKGAGYQWGVFPSIHVGFNDDSISGVPMKIYYYDVLDSEWRTPMRGMWETATAYTAGDYVLYEFKLYRATNNGTSGATAPIHTVGTMSDGTVSWEFIRNLQTSAANGWIQPVVLFGDRDDMPRFGHLNVRAQFHKNAMWINGYRQLFVDADGAVMGWFGKRSDSESLQVEMNDGSRQQFFPGWARRVNMANVLGTQERTTGTTIDVQTAEFVEFNHASPTTVAAFTARVNQKFYVAAKNGNTTIQHNAAQRLVGGADRTLTVDDVLCFIRKSDGIIVQVQG